MGIIKTEQFIFDNLTASQKEAISSILECPGINIVSVTGTYQYEVTTPDDPSRTLEETEEFWEELFRRFPAK